MQQSFVLNVNDDEASRYMVTRMLERSGFWVREAQSGAQAMDMAREGAALIVLDINLPDISGLEVCRTLKADPITSSIPILQTSATFVSSERKIEGLESGADGYLVQPIEPLELIATVNALLRARQAEDALRQAAMDWQRTFDALGDAVAVASGDGRVLRYNPAMQRLLGLSSTEDLVSASTRLHELLGPQPEWAGRSEQPGRTHATHDIEHGGRFYRFVLDPIPSTLASLDRWVIVLSDITDQKELQQRERRHAEELRADAQRKDEFLAMLAHELRNPLHAVSTALKLLDRVGAQDDSNVEIRDAVNRQIRHLARLVDDLLDVSRITRGKISLQLTGADLREQLKHALDIGRAQAAGRGQTIELSMPDEPVPVRIDTVRLEQAITNIITNAVKYSPRDSTIRVSMIRSVGGDEDRARVVVEDEGDGIPPAKLSEIFELFVQVEQTLARSRGGLGIGLTVARSLVELHGGLLFAESPIADGRGSRFTIDLPVHEDALAELAPEAPVPVGPRGARLSIVIIEDNEDAAHALRGLLEDRGHLVRVAHTGSAGRELIEAHAPDVALVDVGLPGMNGYEVAQAVRADHPRRPRLVAVTGYGLPRDRERAFEAGFDDFLIKPVDVNLLESTLAKVHPRQPVDVA
jgi:signal transduction histidine kinase